MYISLVGEGCIMLVMCIGYLGIVKIEVDYTFDSCNNLCIDYIVIIDVDMVFNFINYVYWNFAGEGFGMIYD